MMTTSVSQLQLKYLRDVSMAQTDEAAKARGE
jgi:hypothetical protein